MKERRRREKAVSWNRFFLFVVFSCIFLSALKFSTFRPFGESFHPVLIPPWRNSAIEAISTVSTISPSIEILSTVVLPDQVLIFLKYPSSSPIFPKHDLLCAFFPPNASRPQMTVPPAGTDAHTPTTQIVRCPSPPRGFTTSLSLKSNGHLPPGPTHRWDSLVYEALIDQDNTTILFVKGLNLRAERLSLASRFVCVYGWDLSKPRFQLSSQVVSAAQEIVRCKTPLSVLKSPKKSIKVSVRVMGRGTISTIAHPEHRLETDPQPGKKHEMCVCSMVRNQARFLREWVMYHAHIGVQRWFIYDNNSDDPIQQEIELLTGSGHNVTRHVWPWVKTQEAGFAHCALRARGSCNWVGFIDVDEFLYLNSNVSLHEILRNQSGQVGEIRTMCHSFGPSGLRRVPVRGVTVGYDCRLAAPERHKSIVRPDVLNSSLINVVHHFHVREGIGHVTFDRGVMVINHYKYQVWEVFKEKFYRRVATYVADWQNEENVGSKDRAPGLGTRAVEPEDWSSRFCEVKDTGLRDMVVETMADPRTKRLPWQEEEDEQEQDGLLVEENKM